MPRVSIVVPTHNRLGLLQRALASVAAQKYRNFEIVVVDDGSTDGTSDWLMANGFGSSLVSLPAPRGAAAARNRGIERSTGELVAFLDDDDWWQPDYLAAQVAMFDRGPETALCYADHLEVDSDGCTRRPDTRSLLAGSEPLVRLFAEGFIHTMSTVMVRRAVVDRVGPLDENLTIVHDLEWYGRLLALGLPFARVDRALVARSLPGGLIGNYPRWFTEEQWVISQAATRSALVRQHGAMIRTQRSLFFAKVALGRGDLRFGGRRLAEALFTSPVWALKVVALRLVRWIGFQRKSVSWDAVGVGTR